MAGWSFASPECQCLHLPNGPIEIHASYGHGENSTLRECELVRWCVQTPVISYIVMLIIIIISPPWRDCVLWVPCSFTVHRTWEPWGMFSFSWKDSQWTGAMGPVICWKCKGGGFRVYFLWEIKQFRGLWTSTVGISGQACVLLTVLSGLKF